MSRTASGAIGSRRAASGKIDGDLWVLAGSSGSRSRNHEGGKQPEENREVVFDVGGVNETGDENDGHGAQKKWGQSDQ